MRCRPLQPLPKAYVGNTLSPVIRKAWDGGKLSTLTKNTPLTATGAHISIIAHITIDELRARLTRTDIANGFANRFLYPLVRRSKELPFGGDLSDSEILFLGENTQQALDIPRNIGRVTWTEAAANEWQRVYSALSAGRRGLLGAATARGVAHAVRLALLYALLDGEASLGLIWLLCGRSVSALTEHSAAIANSSGAVTVCYRAGRTAVSITACADRPEPAQENERRNEVSRIE